jgi:predicted AlkP superfamily phosphohydrolase/phosphomutase
MGSGLAAGVSRRTDIVLWLLTERFPEWQLGLIGVSESHSVLEALWHGIDAAHPLHSHSSSPAAAEGIHEVYRAIDQLVGTLTAKFEDATFLLFSPHGMGPNRSDVPSTVLLPELLHRYAFSRSFFVQPESWTFAPGGLPIIGEDDNWHVVTPDLGSTRKRIRARVLSLFPERVKEKLKRMLRVQADAVVKPPMESPKEKSVSRRRSLEWMPAARYRHRWSKMPAFAVPSFYDGRIRINLQGRERKGVVPIEEYEFLCDKISRLLEDCRDPFSGESVVDGIERYGHKDPLDLAASDADLKVKWKGISLCWEHPDLGQIGPVPFRRTGGHTGPYGMAYLKSDILKPGDYGTRSSFDVVPTIFDLLDERLPSRISGKSLIRN